MKNIYRKMYATLAGRVDTVLNFMEERMMQQRCDWDAMHYAEECLRKALLEAEDMYLDADEEEDE